LVATDDALAIVETVDAEAPSMLASVPAGGTILGGMLLMTGAAGG